MSNTLIICLVISLLAVISYVWGKIPMATPAVPMIMAEGNYTFTDMVKQSLIPAVLFCIVTVIWTMTVFPLYA